MINTRFRITPPVDGEFATGVFLKSRGNKSILAPDQGMRSLSWIDSNSDGNLGPGDGFVGTLNECWFNDPTDDVDELLNGVGNFLGYVENIDQNREVITAIGFTSITPTPSGVFYTDFTISETEATSPGTAEITNVIGLEGGVSILFTEP